MLHICELHESTRGENKVSFTLYTFPTVSDKVHEIIIDSCMEMVREADRKGLEEVYIPSVIQEPGQKAVEKILDDRFIMCTYIAEKG